MQNYQEFLNNTYQKLWKKGKEAILNNKFFIDPYLSKKDNRLGLTILIPLEGECTKQFSKIINKLKEIEPEQYFYPLENLHVTVVSVSEITEDFIPNETIINKYKEILSQTIKEIPEFTIKFKGITASDLVIFIKGFSDDTIQKLRNNFKEQARNQGLKIDDRYETKIIHSTIARFKNKLKNPEQLIKKIEELNNIEIANYKVNKIQFLINNWYNKKENNKLLAEYKL